MINNDSYDDSNYINNVLESVYMTIIWNIQNSLGKGSGKIIDSVEDHNINISKYISLAGTSYIKLPKELNHPKKGLIDIQNIQDNEWFKWCLIRYFYPEDDHLARIQRVERLFGDELDFKVRKFPVKIKDFHKIDKNNYISISVFGYETKVKYQSVVKKMIEEVRNDIKMMSC